MEDSFEKAIQPEERIKGQTGFIFDIKFAEHKNPWDPNHIECPERILRAKKRCEELKLTEKCRQIQTRMATEEEMLICHSKEYLQNLASISKMDPNQRREKCLKDFHSVYMNEQSFEVAKLAVGSAIELTKSMLTDQIQNGLALLRPPGHHAQKSFGNGFCLLNNVAIAARYAQKMGKRVVIVDLDVHHGQGSQYFFYDDPDVIYFSIHRWEFGEFWPHLREGNFDYIGGDLTMPSCGKNINIPLNKTGLGDSDYLSIFHQVLLPVLHEFNPDLILVSAGFDSSIGCPEGQMKVTPAAYSHMVHSLMSFADGKVGVFLEGGYFIESLAEGVAMSLRALLGYPCLSLGSLAPPDDSLVSTNLNAISMLRKPWNCFNLQGEFNIKTYDIMKEIDCHVPVLIFKGENLGDENGEFYEVNDEKTIAEAHKTMKNLKAKYDLDLKRLNLSENLPVAMVCSEEMRKYLQRFELFQRVCHLPPRKATKQELKLLYDFDATEEMELKMDNDLINFGNLCKVVHTVCNDQAKSGVAILEQSSHHVKADKANFCLFNSVAMATKYAMKMHSVKRILILDLGFHQDNGIQNMFKDDPNVLYISLGKSVSNHNFVESGSAQGYNINIPWSDLEIGDPEFSMALFGLVLPVAYQFDPDLVLVSPGFDSVQENSCRISPEFYGFLTYHLKALANGKVIVVFENGNNSTSINFGMKKMVKSLLGDPIPRLALFTKPISSAIQAVQNTIESLKPYWSCLKYSSKLPDDMSNLRQQMADKMNDFIKSSHGVDMDCLPKQFEPYCSTFGVSTLSEMTNVLEKSS